MAVKKLAYYLIPLIVFILVVLWQFGPSGLLDGVKGAVKDVIDLAPEVTVGSEDLKGEKPTIPPEHNTAIRKLVDTIKKMKESKEINCFAKYGGLPELGEAGTSLSFQLKDDETTLKISGGAGGTQFVSLEEIDFKPCVIAGSEEVVKNFGISFLNTKNWNEKIIQPKHYTPVNAINIFYSTSKRNANVIRIPEFGSNVVNKESKNFMDAGFLYKPDKEHICFFPTVWGDNVCDGSDEDGLDDNCLGQSPIGDISIPNQWNKGTLKKCLE